MKTKDNIQEYTEGCIPSDLLIKYVKGELVGLEKNRIERHLSSCEICSDELEGITNMKNPSSIDDITLEINQKIDVLIAKPRSEISSFSFYIRIAASIALIIGVTTIVYITVFRKTPSLIPNYAMTEKESLKSAAMDSNKDQIQESVAGVEKMENIEMPAPQEDNSINKGKRAKAKTDNTIAYVAPVVVDSISSMINNDEIIVEEVSVATSDSNVQNEQEIAEAKEIAAESPTKPVTISSEKKSVFARSGLAKDELASGSVSFKEFIASKPYDARKRTAINLLDMQKYEDAITIFNKLYIDFPNNDSIIYYTSLCNYHLNQFNETVAKMSVLTKKPQSAFYYQAEWYSALALIKLGKKVEAKVILEQILSEDSPFIKDAKRELEKLKDTE